MATRNAHVINPKDRDRAECTHPDHEPGLAAGMVEHSPHAGGISFFRYCGSCWHKPAANGGPSAAERTGVELPDVLDFERRWLAECRAHGETRRKLEATDDILDRFASLIDEVRNGKHRYSGKLDADALIHDLEALRDQAHGRDR